MPSYVDATGVTQLTADIKALADATYPSNEAIAQEYDATSAYAVGDYCINGGLLYKCNTAIATGGETWTAAHWTKVSVVDEMGSGDATGVVRVDVAQEFTGSEQQQARENISAEAKSLRFFNTVVPVSAFDKNEDSYAITITINTAATDTDELIIDREVFDQAFLNLNLSEGTYTFSMTNGRFIISPGNINTDYFEFNTTSKTYLMPSWGMTINKNNYSPDSGNWFTLTYVAPHTVSPYEDYPCRATIPLTNVTSMMIPDVIFALEDSTSGIFSPNSETYNGGVYIYSSEIPSNSIVIPTIVCWKPALDTSDSNWNIVPHNIYTITLPASGWVSTDSTEQYWHIGNPYYQVVAIPNAVTTSYTKVDLQPNTQVLTHLDSVRATGIYTENHNGAITVYVNGGKPTENLSIQCTVLEMDAQNPVGNYVGMPTSSDEYHNFADMDGTSYINDTNWTSYHTGFHLKNGWGMIVINGATKVAMSADTFYEIVDLPSFLVEKIGATSQQGFAFAGSVPCMAELTTWDGNHAIKLFPRGAVGANTNIQGTIVFVVS